MKVIDNQFAICIGNEGYEASLIAGKVYRLIPDKAAVEQDMLRLIDESGEDYLFHTNVTSRWWISRRPYSARSSK